MGLIESWKRKRRRRAYQRAVTTLFEEINGALTEAYRGHAVAVCTGACEQERSLAEKVDAGDAVVLGVNEETGATIVAERAAAVDAENAAAQERVLANHRAMRAAMEPVVPSVNGVRANGPVEHVSFGKQVAGGTKRTAIVDLHHAWDRDVPVIAPWCGSESCPKEHRIDTPCAERCDPTVDDGPVPPQSEIDAVMRAGFCDSVELVGETVLYETDGRGGKRYAVAAIVTCVQRTHADLPLLRGAEEAEHVHRVQSVEMSDPRELLGEGWALVGPDGYLVGTNPLPIPLDGTVHLWVVSPGEPYRELSVPFDPTGATPRSFRLRTQPF